MLFISLRFLVAKKTQFLYLKNLFGEYLNDASVVAVARTRRWGRKLQKNARKAIWIVEAIRQCAIPNEFTIFQTEKDSLFGRWITEKNKKMKCDHKSRYFKCDIPLRAAQPDTLPPN